MSLDILHLPYDIPVVPLHRMGYAPSANSATALQESILSPCERNACAFRGNLVPDLMPASRGLHATAKIARAKATRSGMPEWGFLFRVTVHAMIARPSPRMASTLADSDGIDIWNALRPFAEERRFHGIKLPGGLVVFRAAQDGILLHEEFAWRVKSNGEPAW